MDSFVTKDQNIIKIFHNAFPNSLEYLLFNVYPDKLEINGIDKAKSFFCQLILNKNCFDSYEVSNSHNLPISTKQFNNTIKSAALRFLTYPSMTMNFDDINIYILISDKNKISGININKQIRSVKIIKSEAFGIPNLPKFADTPFCFVDNPEYLRSVYNSFSGVVFIELSIEDYLIKFKGKDEMENNSEVSVEARFNDSGSSKILLDSFKSATDICELKSIKQSKISISNDGIVKFSHELENGTMNYYISKAIE